MRVFTVFQNNLHIEILTRLHQFCCNYGRAQIFNFLSASKPPSSLLARFLLLSLYTTPLYSLSFPFLHFSSFRFSFPFLSLPSPSLAFTLLPSIISSLVIRRRAEQQVSLSSMPLLVGHTGFTVSLPLYLDLLRFYLLKPNLS